MDAALAVDIAPLRHLSAHVRKQRPHLAETGPVLWARTQACLDCKSVGQGDRGWEVGELGVGGVFIRGVAIRLVGLDRRGGTVAVAGLCVAAAILAANTPDG